MLDRGTLPTQKIRKCCPFRKSIVLSSDSGADEMDENLLCGCLWSAHWNLRDFTAPISYILTARG